MIATAIRMFGQPCILVCDGKCNKAWGMNNRPRIYLEDPEQRVYDETGRRYPDDDSIDLDNHVELADSELGEAPIDPGTYEGGHAKPITPAERHNKWCARECERSRVVDDGQDFELHDYSKRAYNYAPHTREHNEPAT